MKLLALLLLTASLLLSRTIILEEEQVDTTKGQTFYILTMCKDGYQYTGYHKGELLDFKIVQDFKQSMYPQAIPIPCQMDFKHQSQLDK